jgi:biopolymer transport protein ExbD
MEKTLFRIYIKTSFMEELIANGNSRNKAGVRKTKKLSTRVDLTPMVDLGFLLITFFVFTTAMSKPSTMKLHLPKREIEKMHTPESTILTIIPMQLDLVYYYNGKLEDALKTGEYGITNFSFSNGIGSIIRKKQERLDKHLKFNRKDLMLIIKPSEKASYKNIIDAMDEAIINGVTRYSLADIQKEEMAVLTN